VAADANLAGHMYPDQSLYPANSVPAVVKRINQTLQRADQIARIEGKNDVDWFVPHQANKRILDGAARKLGLAPERIIVTVDKHANTSAASIPLALSTGCEDGRIKPGDLVLIEAMGGGFTWGAILIRW